MTIRWVLILTTLLTLSKHSNANDIYIDSIGDDFELNISQEGENNSVGNSSFDATNNGKNNSYFIKQRNTGQTSSGGTIEFDVTGDNNNIQLGQGYTGSSAGNVFGNTDTTESGAKVIDVIVLGDSNNIHVGQRNGSIGNYDAHSTLIDVAGNSNSIDAEQTNDGLKSIDIDLSGNGHSVYSRQMNDGAHTSTIDLNNGGGAYSLSVTQNSTTAQSYTLQGTCYTANGCAVSVTQN